MVYDLIVVAEELAELAVLLGVDMMAKVDS
jgi:hypothetical protein